jgi:YNFM family putative membrane transporter
MSCSCPRSSPRRSPARWWRASVRGRPFAVAAAGLGLIAAGTFFAQATATGFVGRAATTDRGSASGLYLASYFLGGLAGSAVLGLVFDRLGWTVCVAGIGVSLILGALLSTRLRLVV